MNSGLDRHQVLRLYKVILRLHRGLPEEMQVIGTNYARDEFRRHKFCSSQEAGIFMKEWSNYAISVAEQLGLRGKPSEPLGKDMSQEAIEHLQDQQILQLYELMKVTKAPKV